MGLNTIRRLTERHFSCPRRGDALWAAYVLPNGQHQHRLRCEHYLRHHADPQGKVSSSVFFNMRRRDEVVRCLFAMEEIKIDVNNDRKEGEKDLVTHGVYKKSVSIQDIVST